MCDKNMIKESNCLPLKNATRLVNTFYPCMIRPPAIPAAHILYRHVQASCTWPSAASTAVLALAGYIKVVGSLDIWRGQPPSKMLDAVLPLALHPSPCNLCHFVQSVLRPGKIKVMINVSWLLILYGLASDHKMSAASRNCQWLWYSLWPA